MQITQITAGQKRWTVTVCGLLLACFAVISYSAVLTKCATIDEPTQDVAGWLALKEFDFRLETVSPPLWEMWAAMGNYFTPLPIRRDGPIWNNLTWDPAAEVILSSQTLFGTNGFDGGAFINRSRAMMLIIAVGLGIMVAWWSAKLAGPVAAIVATFLFSFDPNFLGHSPLVKGDVTFSLVVLLLAFWVWRLGQRATIGRVLMVSLLCGVAVNIKFSGVIVGPLLAILLTARGVLGEPWEFEGRSIQTRLGRLSVGFAIGFFAALCCFLVTWGCYGFRFRPAPSPQVQMDMPAIYRRAAVVETTAELMRTPTADELAQHVPGAVCRFVEWADQRHFLPQAMLAGLLYQHTCVQMWPAYLNGDLYGTGRMIYFPLAMLYKTPVAELLIFGAATLLLLTRYEKFTWTACCVVAPVAVFGLAAITSHLNIGLRNVLPLFPFFQISAGCAATLAWRKWRRVTGGVLLALGIGLMTEVLMAWPNYIAFFNLPTGGERGGIAHLADSNLDWGQDLPQLAQWQQQHPTVQLFARLYSGVDPHFYGLRFHPISIDARTGRAVSDVSVSNGMIAVSATHLQGLYIKPWESEFYLKLRESKPAGILGGTIYLYPCQPGL